MVMGEQGLDDLQNQHVDTIQQTENPEGPTSESLELMESIIQRLQPKDRHHIREMISFRGLVSGSLASMLGLSGRLSPAGMLVYRYEVGQRG